jgi:mercuric ion transport protein
MRLYCLKPIQARREAASAGEIEWLTPYLSTRCRLYPMQTATKQLWTSVLAAIVGSLCCVAPLVFITLGISGAWISQLTALEPYRPIFIGVMLVFIGLAFRQLYIVPARCAPGEACANPRLQRRQRLIFWVVVVGLAALSAFPWYAPLLIG